MNQIKIAISGPPYAGKTTLAEELTKQGRGAVYTFTRGIGECFFHIFGHYPKDRHELQKFGLSCREIEPDVWIREFDDYVSQRCSGITACDQLRFPNELEYFKRNGWMTVRLSVSLPVREQRKLKRTGKRGLSDNELNHECETALNGHLDEFDLILDGDNNTPEQLAKVVLEKVDKYARYYVET